MNKSTNQDSPDSISFANFRHDAETNHNIKFLEKLSELPIINRKEKSRMAIISSRTSSNPALFNDAIGNGCNTIYLEKPGAPTTIQLILMRDESLANEVGVFLGYNKNVTPYVTNAISKFRDIKETKEKIITFVHNNNVPDTPEGLGECFETNSEGLLKNMLIHELAILATYFKIKAVDIETGKTKVIFDKNKTKYLTLKGPSTGKNFTDFKEIWFNIISPSGEEIRIGGDRCGGTVSFASIKSPKSSKDELARFECPSKEDLKDFNQKVKQLPKAKSYFLSQDKDYEVLKNRISFYSAEGVLPEGGVGIDGGIEAMKIAEELVKSYGKVK